MSRICDVCGKGPLNANVVSRRGLAKKKNGAGRKITGITQIWRYPNLSEIRIQVENHTKKIKICAKCLKRGNFKKVA
jgi:large subunit ribosomal protein L28